MKSKTAVGGYMNITQKMLKMFNRSDSICARETVNISDPVVPSTNVAWPAESFEYLHLDYAISWIYCVKYTKNKCNRRMLNFAWFSIYPTFSPLDFVIFRGRRILEEYLVWLSIGFHVSVHNHTFQEVKDTQIHLFLWQVTL